MDTHFQRIERLPPYVFNIIGELKQAARARGEDIIDFGMGNPDQPTPEHIVEKTPRDGVARRHTSVFTIQGYTEITQGDVRLVCQSLLGRH